MDMRSLEDLMTVTLQELYGTEMQELQQAGPEMAKAISNPQLLEAVSQHLRETESQVQRLERVMTKMGVPPTPIQTQAMQGLVEDGRRLMQMQQNADPDVLDAGLTCAQQKIEHLEIAGYGTAVTFAKLLGDQESAQLLGEILAEEKRADEMLTQIAQSRINPEAAQSA
jgi:ferritin-like metal-binding protein YciE